MKIYLATWLQEISQKEALDKAKKSERLLSYHFITETKIQTIDKYLEIK